MKEDNERYKMGRVFIFGMLGLVIIGLGALSVVTFRAVTWRRKNKSEGEK